MHGKFADQNPLSFHVLTECFGLLLHCPKLGSIYVKDQKCLPSMIAEFCHKLLQSAIYYPGHY